MRVRRQAQWVGTFLVLGILFVPNAFAAKGRIEARARVVAATAAQEAAGILAREAQGLRSRGAAPGRTHTAQGAEFRVQRQPGEGPQAVWVLEWIDS